jgi:hypothetical protein
MEIGRVHAMRLTLLLSLITATLINRTSASLAVIGRVPTVETSSYYRPSEPFSGHVPQLSTNFEEILARVRVNSEEQNKVLETSVIVINYRIIITNGYHIV